MFTSSVGPVAYWRPVRGQRHALSAEWLPHPGQVRDALCGLRLVLTEPSDHDWLAETCTACLNRAKALRDERTRA